MGSDSACRPCQTPWWAAAFLPPPAAGVSHSLHLTETASNPEAAEGEEEEKRSVAPPRAIDQPTVRGA